MARVRTERDDVVEALEVVGAAVAALAIICTLLLSRAWQVPPPPGPFASVSDRPLIEDVDSVWKARATGVSEFPFDGEHYVITNLPEEYLAYSEKACRMP